MKILMYGWEFPPHISGGLGVACFGLTRALADKGHQITFVVPRLESPDNTPHLDLVGVNQFPLNPASDEQAHFISRQIEALSGTINTETISSPLSPYLTKEQYLLELQRLEARRDEIRAQQEDENGFMLDMSGDYGPNLMTEIMRYASVAGSIASRVPHDIIHAHDWLTMLAGIEARNISGAPLVVHVHATEFDRSGVQVNQAIYDIERHGMEQADQVIAVSHYTKETLVRHYGISPDKIAVVHNAVTREFAPHATDYQRQTREKVVLFLGRITFQKGPDYFVEAAARVLAAREDVRFVMAGSGDMAPRMIERIAELKLGRKFHFTGFLRGSEVEKIFRESDVYVMPSVSEPFGISPLEAMHYDVPVIISKTSGVAEVLHSALKVDFWDVDELASKILAVLSHEPLRREMIEHGAEELKALQWSTAAIQVTDVYAALKNR